MVCLVLCCTGRLCACPDTYVCPCHHALLHMHKLSSITQPASVPLVHAVGHCHMGGPLQAVAGPRGGGASGACRADRVPHHTACGGRYAAAAAATGMTLQQRWWPAAASAVVAVGPVAAAMAAAANSGYSRRRKCPSSHASQPHVVYTRNLQCALWGTLLLRMLLVGAREGTGSQQVTGNTVRQRSAQQTPLGCRACLFQACMTMNNGDTHQQKVSFYWMFDRAAPVVSVGQLPGYGCVVMSWDPLVGRHDLTHNVLHLTPSWCVAVCAPTTWGHDGRGGCAYCLAAMALTALLGEQQVPSLANVRMNHFCLIGSLGHWHTCTAAPGLCATCNNTTVCYAYALQAKPGVTSYNHG